MNGHTTSLVCQGAKVSSDNPLPVSHTQTLSCITSFETCLSDAFGRLRVSMPFTLFDSFHRYQDNGKITQYTSGSASSTHDSNSGSIVLSVGGTLGDAIYRESSRVFAYQPGKSLLVLQTFCMSPAKTGLRQRQGYFDVANGIFIEMNGDTLSFVKRSSASGATQDTKVEQPNWNVDQMNGNGPSGVNLDPTKAQIMFIDIEWLGVGSVRTGFVIEGRFLLCHVFHHANQPGTTKPYMTTACLPVRVELENISNTNSPSNYRIICTSIMSEGGYELRGRQRTIGIDTIDSPKNLHLKNTFYPVINIRLKSNRLGAIVIPTRFSLIGTTSSDYRWKVVVNCSLSNASWISVGTDSSVEYDILASNSVVDGTALTSGYFTASAGSSQVIALESTLFKFQLERNSFTNTTFPFTIAVASKDANSKVLASIDWEEVT